MPRSSRTSTIAPETPTRRSRRSPASPAVSNLLEHLLVSRSPRRTANAHPESRPQPRKPLKTVAHHRYPAEGPSMPPVMARGVAGTTYRPARSSPTRAARARRRYDVSLSVPGAEMRLPSLPQVNVGWRLASGVMVALLAIALYQLWNLPRFRVVQAQVNGLQRLTSSDVNAVLELEDTPIFAVDSTQLQQNLEEAFPEFSSVKVSASLPNKVVVTVEERVPILTWRQDGRTTLVDANGISFPMRSPNDALPSPRVEAFNTPPVQTVDGTSADQQRFLSPEMVSAIMSMSAQAPANTPLVYDGQHGLGWKDPQGWEVYFGDMKDMGIKLTIYKTLIKRLQEEGITPALVSVEYIHSPYYRVEK